MQQNKIFFDKIELYLMLCCDLDEKTSEGNQKHLIEFSGESRPEDTRNFFTPVFEWLEEYKKYILNINRLLVDILDSITHKNAIEFHNSNRFLWYDLAENVEIIVKNNYMFYSDVVHWSILTKLINYTFIFSIAVSILQQNPR